MMRSRAQSQQVIETVARRGEAAPIRVDRPCCFVGDIHGRADLLAALIGRIVRECPDGAVVCLGDYVDRGPDSAAVLRGLMDEATAQDTRLTCLAGNHEDMLLAFLDRPELMGARWLRAGGGETLASFGLRRALPTASSGELRALSGALRNAMGEELIDWLRHLPVSWSNGNVVAVHAGPDPARPIAGQDRRNMLWGHPNFGRVARPDGAWIVHGHVMVAVARVLAGRVAIDTGAYATGRLTALILAPDTAPRFLSTAD